MPPLEPHAIAVMALTVAALVLFTQERIPLETSSLLVLAALVLGFQLYPYEGPAGHVDPVDLFAGFGNEALVAVCALMVLGKGLEVTGALQPVARALARLWQNAPGVSLLGTMLIAAALSAVVNNTPIVVMLLPILVAVSLGSGSSPSGTLMPFGLATVIGGSVTTIGTSTNLLVVAVAQDLGVQPFTLFEFTLPLALVGLGGIGFLWLVGPRLLPVREAPLRERSERLFSAVLYLDEDSKIAGQTLADVRELLGGKLRLLDIQRGESLFLARLPTLVLAAGDRLHVLDTPDRLKELEGILGASLHGLEQDSEGAEQTANEEAPGAGQQRLVEVVVTPDSPLNRSTVKRERFADEYGLYVLAVHRGQRQAEVRRNHLGDLTLTTGDVLLVQGAAGDIARLKTDTRFLVLDSVVDLPDRNKVPLALGIMGAAIGFAALGLLPISVSALLGVAAMLVTGCLRWREAVKGLSVQVIMIVVASLALGTALIRTGATDYIANGAVLLGGGLHQSLVLGGLILMMAVLTNILSNNAAGIIGTPIAIGIAHQLGLAPEPFVVAIIAGVNLSFATPMAYQTNLLVMHAGGYKFMDFVRVGVPLLLLMAAAHTLVIPHFFPF